MYNTFIVSINYTGGGGSVDTVFEANWLKYENTFFFSFDIYEFNIRVDEHKYIVGITALYNIYIYEMNTSLNVIQRT